MSNRPNTQCGFSLLELLIVVAIILIIASIAIPSLLRSRQSAHESGAAASMKSINIAQNVYMMTNQGFGEMADLIAGGLIRNVSTSLRHLHSEFKLPKATLRAG